jgi:hypothetical protein
MRSVWLAVVWLAACGSSAEVADAARPADASTSCWRFECPDDAGVAQGGATLCGACKHHFADTECPPGFVCSCDLDCVHGPRSTDGGLCPWDLMDAGPDTTPDAHVFDWPTCDP